MTVHFMTRIAATGVHPDRGKVSVMDDIYAIVYNKHIGNTQGHLLATIILPHTELRLAAYSLQKVCA